MENVNSSIVENFNEAVNFIIDTLASNPKFLSENSEIRKKMYEIYKSENFDDIIYQEEFDDAVKNFEKQPSCSISSMKKHKLGELAEKLIVTFPEVKLFIHERDFSKSVIVALFTAKQIAVNSLADNSCAIPVRDGYHIFGIDDISKKPIITIIEVFGGSSKTSYTNVAKKEVTGTNVSPVAPVKKQIVAQRKLTYDECPAVLNHDNLKNAFSDYSSFSDAFDRHYTRYQKDEKLTYFINQGTEYTIGPITDKYVCNKKSCYGMICLRLHKNKVSTNKNACESCNLYTMEFKKNYNTDIGYPDTADEDINYFRFVSHIFKCTMNCKRKGCLNFEIKKINMNED